MSKGDLIEIEGVIEDAMGGGQYRIRVDASDHGGESNATVRAKLAGKMKLHRIQVLPGDKVKVAVSPYDLTHGLIVYRGRKR